MHRSQGQKHCRARAGATIQRLAEGLKGLKPKRLSELSNSRGRDYIVLRVEEIIRKVGGLGDAHV